MRTNIKDKLSFATSNSSVHTVLKVDKTKEKESGTTPLKFNIATNQELLKSDISACVIIIPMSWNNLQLRTSRRASRPAVRF